jgi:hypothetical protein
MSSPAHILPAPESVPHRVVRFAGRWIGWTGISLLLTFGCSCVAGAYALDRVGAVDYPEVASSGVYAPSQWQIDELAVLER